MRRKWGLDAGSKGRVDLWPKRVVLKKGLQQSRGFELGTVRQGGAATVLECGGEIQFICFQEGVVVLGGLVGECEGKVAGCGWGLCPCEDVGNELG